MIDTTLLDFNYGGYTYSGIIEVEMNNQVVNNASFYI